MSRARRIARHGWRSALSILTFGYFPVRVEPPPPGFIGPPLFQAERSFDLMAEWRTFDLTLAQRSFELVSPVRAFALEADLRTFDLALAQRSFDLTVYFYEESEVPVAQATYSREVVQGLQVQGRNENIYWRVRPSPAPVSVTTVQVYVTSDLDSDMRETVMPDGDPVIDDDWIILPKLLGSTLTVGLMYRVEVQFVDAAGNDLEAWFRVRCER
jgi:hypothetical protein